MSNENQRHPNSAFKATYPYNQATVTRSGHEIHLNDTPEHESIRIAHTKGSYFELEANGRWTQVVAERFYNYIKNSMTQTVDSHYDLKVGGTYALNIDQSAVEQVGKNKTVGIGENLVEGVGGVRELHTESDKYESVNGDAILGIKGSRHEAVEGDSVTSINGAKTDILQSDWMVSSQSGIEFNADGTIRFKCKKFIVDAEEIIMTTTGGDIRITASGITYINGAQVRLND
jgi:hypothetical protein